MLCLLELLSLLEALSLLELLCLIEMLYLLVVLFLLEMLCLFPRNKEIERLTKQTRTYAIISQIYRSGDNDEVENSADS